MKYAWLLLLAACPGPRVAIEQASQTTALEALTQDDSADSPENRAALAAALQEMLEQYHSETAR